MHTAVFSLFHKDGLEAIAGALTHLDAQWHFYGSRGTALRLGEAGYNSTDIATIAGDPSPDHLVVTLSQIHFGILCNRSRPDHMADLQQRGLPYVDLVWVSLYDIRSAIQSREGEETVRQATDMGGVALLRSGAKGRWLVAANLDTMKRIVQWLREGRQDEENFRRWLAVAAEEHCRLSKSFIRTHMLSKYPGYKPPGLADIEIHS